MKISIIGLGLIGGSLAKAIKSFDNSLTISAYDYKETITKAKAEGIIDYQINSFSELTDEDIIFLSLPIYQSLDALKQIAPIVKTGCIITDVCSVKNIFFEEWAKFHSRGVFIGGHPMTGKEKSGYDNADALLFENAVYILCGEEKVIEAETQFLNLLHSIGAKVRFIDAKTHDEIVANVSHLPQLLAVSLVNTITNFGSKTESIEFAAGGFRDMTRIASSNFEIWESIFSVNKKNITSSINNLIEKLEQFKSSLEVEDFIKISKLFETARYMREAIPKQNKGFLNPVFDLFISVKDEPGVLSKLTTLMFDNNINIKDMELLKIREGAQGTFRLSFESESAVILAKELLQKHGFIFS